jgi:hypothetical protein
MDGFVVGATMTEDQQVRLIDLTNRLLSEAERPMSEDRLAKVHGLLWAALLVVNQSRSDEPSKIASVVMPSFFV